MLFIYNMEEHISVFLLMFSFLCQTFTFVQLFWPRDIELDDFKLKESAE